MAVKVAPRIEFKQHIPYRTEHKLIHERGFRVLYRTSQGAVFIKDGKSTDKNSQVPWTDNSAYPHSLDDSDNDPKDVSEISPWRAADLERKCERVVGAFVDPYRDMTHIRSQILKMASRDRVTEIEQEWIENWIYTNLI